MTLTPPQRWSREVMYCHCGLKILRLFDGVEYHYRDWWAESQTLERCFICNADPKEVHHWHEAMKPMEGLAS
jgi:hypothetical protein